MIHTYAIEGMKDNNCAEAIATRLAQHPKVMEVKVSLEKYNATVDMKEHIPTEELQLLLAPEREYQILQANAPVMPLEDAISLLID